VIWADGRNALHDAWGIAKPHMFERDCGQPQRDHGEELAWAKQKFGVCRPAEPLVPGCERLVDQNAVAANASDNFGQYWPPEVIGDNHPIKDHACKRKGTAAFQIGCDQPQPGTALEVCNKRKITIDANGL
jgi:hypothetical protein